MTTTVTLDGRDIQTLAASLIPFASKHRGGVPALTYVHLTTRDGWLYGEASDRYRLAVRRVKAGISGPDLDALLPASSLKAIAAATRPGRGVETSELTLAFERESVVVTATGGLRFDGLHEVRQSWGLSLETWFDGMTALLERALKPGAAGPSEFAFNPALLADFAKVPREGEPMILTSIAPDKAFGVRIGDNFAGAVMPTRMPESVTALDGAWAAFLSPPKKPARRSKAGAA